MFNHALNIDEILPLVKKIMEISLKKYTNQEIKCKKMIILSVFNHGFTFLFSISRA
jgi:hypothetical protein